MRPPRNWKDRFRDAMFECAELRKHKSRLNLLNYIVHKANTKLVACWASQKEMARVCECSVRNIKDLLHGLQDVGALMQVRFSALPLKDQKAINDISPRPMNRSSNVYFLCIGWAEDVLAAGRLEPVPSSKAIGISKEDRKRGTDSVNNRRRRYAPIDLSPMVDFATNPDHEEWLVLNAVPENRGSPASPLFEANRGSPATDITIEYNQAEISEPNSGHHLAGFVPTLSKEENPRPVISSLPEQHDESSQYGYGGGVASAPVPRAVPLARPEGTEYDAAGARANERRAS